MENEGGTDQRPAGKKKDVAEVTKIAFRQWTKQAEEWKNINIGPGEVCPPRSEDALPFDQGRPDWRFPKYDVLGELDLEKSPPYQPVFEKAIDNIQYVEVFGTDLQAPDDWPTSKQPDRQTWEVTALRMASLWHFANTKSWISGEALCSGLTWTLRLLCAMVFSGGDVSRGGAGRHLPYTTYLGQSAR